MNKSLIKKILIEAIYVVMQLAFSRINLFGFLSPAGLPFAIVRLLSGGNIFVVIGAYAVSKIYTFWTLQGLLISIYEIVFLALFYFANGYFKIKKKTLLCIGFIFASNILYFYYSLLSLTEFWHFLVVLACEILLLLYFIKFFAVSKNKFIFFKFSHSDYLIYSITILLLSIGIFSYNFIADYIGLFIIAFPLVMLCRLLPTEKYFTVSFGLAIGALVACGNVNLFIFAVVTTILILEFKNFNKYIYALITSVIFTIFAWLFSFYAVFDIISLTLAVVAYIAVPEKLRFQLASAFDKDTLNLAVNELQTESSGNIKARLLLMSETFKDMQNEFKYLVVGNISREKACIELATDVINKCCSNCENFKNCFFGNINKKAHLESVLRKAIENGGATSDDLPSGMQAYCTKSGVMISEINQTAKMYLSYETAMKAEDVSKLVIAGELGNFSDIFADFSRGVVSDLKFNDRLAVILKDKLNSLMIDAKEVLISENESGIDMVLAVIVNEHIMKKEVIDAIRSVTKINFKMQKVKHLEFAGLSLAKFIPLPAIKVDFSVATKAKDGQNGDNVVVTKLSENKFFVAIADGMGHGEGASRISSMVLKLLQSLFMVGLKDELILESVNKLLLPAGLDNFTTLDACVIDADKMICEFIKLGSSVTAIKHQGTSELVVSDSLPIGIVQNLKPTITRKPITAGDMIFIASDGVVDSFSSIEEYKCFINDSKIYNVQKFLEDVISDAEAQSKHSDDMTIIGINLLKNK